MQLPTVDTEKIQDADSTVRAKVETQIENLSHMSPEQIVESVTKWVIEVGLKILLALAIWYVGRWLIRKVRKLMNRVFERRHVDQTLRSFLDSLVSIVLTIILIVITIDILGLSTTSFLALFASAGLALGVALSGTLQNFAGGVMLLLLKPFRIGDYIDAQGKAGTVKNIQLFNTVITTPDNQTVIIPNGPLSTGIINNASREPYKQSTWNIGIKPDADFGKLKPLITSILDADSRIVKERGYNIEITKITGMSVKVLVQAWTKATDQQAVIWKINSDIYSRLPQEGFAFTDP